MLFADNNDAVTFVRCKFIVCGHTFLPETHPHRLIACPAITGLRDQLIARRFPSVLNLWPRIPVAQVVLALGLGGQGPGIAACLGLVTTVVVTSGATHPGPGHSSLSGD